MAGLTIGAVSRATGIPVQTLRTWERRYGFPAPERTETGHRRYRVEVVARLRLIEQAIELGHRASTVVGADAQTLTSLLEVSQRPAAAPPPSEAVGARAAAANDDMDARWLGAEEAAAPARTRSRPELLEAVTALDAGRLWLQLERALVEVGVVPFMRDCVEPLLEAVGAGWRMGTLDIVHERLASELLRDFLATRWRALERSQPRDAARVVCATLPGEQHVLGLHVAALVVALSGARPLWLGPGLPLGELERAVRRLSPQGLALSVSACADGETLRAQLERLGARLGPAVRIVVGGRGAVGGVPGIERAASIDALEDWVASLGG